jgi:hypothetical protein
MVERHHELIRRRCRVGYQLTASVLLVLERTVHTRSMGDELALTPPTDTTFDCVRPRPFNAITIRCQRPQLESWLVFGRRRL